ncbi:MULTISPECIES: hypothetical protein [Bifidobacterium]|uniref:hypothetical protein n=1 Tax=Bifidobacterium TaxID=1678 RepID=UPI001303CE57|nr:MULTISPECIES: hypothetical protein [Bifidobacterium]
MTDTPYSRPLVIRVTGPVTRDDLVVVRLVSLWFDCGSIWRVSARFHGDGPAIPPNHTE